MTVARTQGNETVIAKGLQVGEKVVTDGQPRLTQGAKIEIRTAGGPAGGPGGGGRGRARQWERGRGAGHPRGGAAGRRRASRQCRTTAWRGATSCGGPSKRCREAARRRATSLTLRRSPGVDLVVGVNHVVEFDGLHATGSDVHAKLAHRHAP